MRKHAPICRVYDGSRQFLSVACFYEVLWKFEMRSGRKEVIFMTYIKGRNDVGFREAS
jgi:hypothetical protein